MEEETSTETTTATAATTEAAAAETQTTDTVTPAADAADTEADDETEGESSDDEDGEGEDEAGGEDDPDSDEPASDEADADPALVEFNTLLASIPGEVQAEGDGEADTVVTGADAHAGPDLDSAWAELKAKVEGNWADMAEGSTDNEKLLVAFLDTAMPSIRMAAQAAQQFEQAQLVSEARGYSSAAEAAAIALGERGIKVTGLQLLGIAQNGGLSALANLEQRDPMSYRGQVSPETFTQIFELKFHKQLSQLGGKSAKESTTKKAPRPLSTGGGSSEKKEPQTPQEAFRQARREAAAKVRK